MTAMPDDERRTERAMAALAELDAVRTDLDGRGAALAAVALQSDLAAREVDLRNRLIRLARREGASLRALASATGLSHQTVANLCATPPATDRARSA